MRKMVLSFAGCGIREKLINSGNFFPILSTKDEYGGRVPRLGFSGHFPRAIGFG